MSYYSDINDTELTKRLRKVLLDVQAEMKEADKIDYSIEIETELSIALGLLRAWQLATEREYQTDELHKLRRLTKEICGEL